MPVVGINRFGQGILGSSARSYSTNFASLNETPLRDGSSWYGPGVDWTQIATDGTGIAFGTQDGAGHFDDSVEFLTGSWPSAQTASVTLNIKPGMDGTFQEAAVYLRGFTDGAHVQRGYECGISLFGSYGGVTIWNGPFGNFTSPSDWQGGSFTAPSDGDILSATIVGNTIVMKINGVTYCTVPDINLSNGSQMANVWTYGNPGFGLFFQGGTAAGHKAGCVKGFSARGQ